METFALMLGWAGIYGPTALGAIGSIIGCARAGQARSPVMSFALFTKKFGTSRVMMAICSSAIVSIDKWNISYSSLQQINVEPNQCEEDKVF